ncbi:MAG: YebC/PmpR family DNA-binding transcriptional regulator [Bacillota bacterium]
MSGHSQWANRKHRKARQDAKKGKVYSKMARKITVAARNGGKDPETNALLSAAIDEARSLGVPNDNIERAIKRGTGELEGVRLEEFQYEGYAPGGVALLLEIVSDNRNRTASELRYLFSKHGGNLGESGCVAWMFTRKGRILIRDEGLDEDELFLVAAEGGAEDLNSVNGSFEVITSPADVYSVREALASTGYPVESAGFTYLTDNYVSVEGKSAQRLIRFLDALEDHDDVQEVFGNFDISEEDLEQYAG